MTKNSLITKPDFDSDESISDDGSSSASTSSPDSVSGMDGSAASPTASRAVNPAPNGKSAVLPSSQGTVGAPGSDIDVPALMALANRQAEAIQTLLLIHQTPPAAPAAPQTVIAAREPVVFRKGPKTLNEDDWFRFFVDYDAFSAGNPDAASPLRSLGHVLPLLRFDDRFSAVLGLVEEERLDPSSDVTVMTKRLFDAIRTVFDTDRDEIQLLNAVSAAISPLWSGTSGPASARVAAMTAKTKQVFDWFDSRENLSTKTRLTIYKEALCAGKCLGVNLKALVKSLRQLKDDTDYLSLARSVRSHLLKVEEARKIVQDVAAHVNVEIPAETTLSTTDDTTNGIDTQTAPDTQVQQSNQRAQRSNAPLVFDDPKKAPFKDMTWCKHHKKWGSHKEADCRLRAHSQAVNAGSTVEVILSSTASDASITVSALPDSGSTASFIPEAIFEQLAKKGMMATGPSDLVMIAANTTETPAIRKVKLVVRVPTEGIPSFRELVVTFEVMPALSQQCILSDQVCHTLGLLGDVPTLTEHVTPDEEEIPETMTDELYDNRTPDLSETPEELRDDVRELVKMHKELFDPLSTEPAAMPPMKIPLKEDAVPVQRKPYWLSPALRAAADEEIDRLLALHIVEPSTSNWSAGMFFVEQRDKTRMVIDYKPVNAVSTLMPVPLISCNELLSMLKGKIYFATLDLKSGYHQVPIEDADRYKTAFITHRGLFQFNRVPFGLTNAPSHFQSSMLQVLEGLVFTACLLYVDDILVFGDSKEEFIANLSEVLKRLSKHKLRLGAKKCLIGRESVTFLGNRVSKDGISIDDDRLEAIANMTRPTTLTETRSLLGLLNYYRRFIKNFAASAEPIINLTRKGVTFEWTAEHDEAFKTLVHSLSDKRLLAHPDYTREMVVQTDACGCGIGGVLLQRTADEPDQTVAFFSETLSAAQRKWTLNEKEAYALYRSVREFQNYLRGHPFTAEVDHRNLTFIGTSTSAKVERWRFRLAEFQMGVRFIPGEENVIADALSRVGHIERAASQAISSNEIQGPIADLSVDQRADLIRSAHGNLLSGHPGIKATCDTLAEAGHKWSGMQDEVRDVIKACPVCQKYRLRSVVAYHTGHLMCSTPFETVSVDSIGPIEAGPNGYKHILVIVDNFTRWTELAPTHSTDAETCAQVLLERIFARHGLPVRIHSDNGTQFINSIVKSLLNTLKVKHSTIAPYVPEQNGLVERANQTIMSHLRCILATVSEYEDWAKYVPIVQFVMNTSKHTAIGTSPHNALYGDHLVPQRTLLQRLREEVEPDALPMSEYVSLLRERLSVITETAAKHQEGIILAADAAYTSKTQELEPGDLVLLTYPARHKPKKLSPSYMGPFELVRSLPNNVFELKSLTEEHSLNAHISRLRRFIGDIEKAREVAAADVQEYVVERVVDHRTVDGRIQFRLRWLGYGEKDDTWQPYDLDVAGNESVETYIDNTGLRSLVEADCRAESHDL